MNSPSSHGRLSLLERRCRLCHIVARESRCIHIRYGTSNRFLPALTSLLRPLRCHRAQRLTNLPSSRDNPRVQRRSSCTAGQIEVRETDSALAHVIAERCSGSDRPVRGHCYRQQGARDCSFHLDISHHTHLLMSPGQFQTMNRLCNATSARSGEVPHFMLRVSLDQGGTTPNDRDERAAIRNCAWRVNRQTTGDIFRTRST
jgi:hypothetical protein